MIQTHVLCLIVKILLNNNFTFDFDVRTQFENRCIRVLKDEDYINLWFDTPNDKQLHCYDHHRQTKTYIDLSDPNLEKAIYNLLGIKT